MKQQSTLFSLVKPAAQAVGNYAEWQMTCVDHTIDSVKNWVSNNQARYIGVMDLIGNLGMLYSAGKFENIGRLVSTLVGMSGSIPMIIFGGRQTDTKGDDWEKQFNGLPFYKKVYELMRPKNIIFNIKHNLTRANAGINLFSTIGYALFSGPDTIGKLGEAADIDFAKSKDSTRLIEMLTLGVGATIGMLVMLMKQNKTPSQDIKFEKEICDEWSHQDGITGLFWKIASPVYKIGAFLERRVADAVTLPIAKAKEVAPYGSYAVLSGALTGLFSVASQAVEEIKNVGPNFFASYIFQGVCITDMIDSYAKDDQGKVFCYVVWMLSNLTLANLSQYNQQNRASAPAVVAP